jgi:hypothetical protein
MVQFLRKQKRSRKEWSVGSPDNSLSASLMESFAVLDQLVGSRADVASVLLGAAGRHATLYRRATHSIGNDQEG